MLVELLRQLPGAIGGVRADEALPAWASESAVGQLDTDAGPVEVQVAIRAGFPFAAPGVWVREEGIPQSPPLMPDGSVCWHDAAGEAVDHTRPREVLRHCLDRVRSLLDQSLHERPWSGVMAEYETYWSHQARDGRWLLAPADGRVQALTDVLWVLQATSAGTDGLLVPLEVGELPFPPDRLDMAWVRQHLLSRLTRERRQELSRLIGDRRRAFRVVVFQVPRDNGLDIYLGVRFRPWRGSRHPLRSGRKNAEVEPMAVTCLDMDYLRERGGADLKLKDKHLAVVGCGSVGGQVAFDLVRSGVGRLSLVDHDVMTAGNAFRHVLGMRGTFFPKVQGLATDIQRKYSDVVVRPYPVTIEALLAEGGLPEVDAVVVCVDRPAAAQAVNAALHGSRGGPVVVYAWLEAYGLASHVLRAQPGAPGCFECLLRHPETVELQGNRAALAAGGQDFTKDQAGCGGRYVPFGAVHATRTAAVAVEEVIKGLHGEQGPALVTWRGDDRPFLEAGFRLSGRGQKWPLDAVVQVLGRDAIAVGACPVCA